MQCGHYVSRWHNSLRYDERNCNCQCKGCNIFKNGNIDTYAVKLLEKYDDDILYILEKEKRKTKQWKARELEDLIKIYKLRLEEIR